MKVRFPAVYRLDRTISGSSIRQLAMPAWTNEGEVPTFSAGRLKGHLFKPAAAGPEVAIVHKRMTSLKGFTHLLQGSPEFSADECDLSQGRWLSHPAHATHSTGHRETSNTSDVISSWEYAFRFSEADPIASRPGLRTPQIGAVHAVLSHWTRTSEPATVVLPTGTGKTDTMIAILVAARIKKLLVIVPTDALRSQLADKFIELGVLKAPFCQVVGSTALYPAVCTLNHIPKTVSEITQIFECAQVIVTTSAVAGRCPPNLQSQIASICGHLFIDEAHHAEATTWRTFKENFLNAKVIQFTATPFREDGQLLDGQIVYKYSLKSAQDAGYFKPIEFDPVIEFRKTRADKAIAEKAVNRLRADFAKGHILMARVESVPRAHEVYEIYKRHEDLQPVQLHTGVKSKKEREASMQLVRSGKSRIVICVDMLGEGFDLPELKIAAFHDIRKSLAVTLQLVGRFTRARADLGNAVFIANTADIQVQDELRRLYSRDPDWNVLIPELNDKIVGEQVSLQEFIKGFAKFDGTVPLKRVFPAISAVIFRTDCTSWSPENFQVGITGAESREQIHFTINHAANTLIVVTARRLALKWTDAQHLYDWEWELIVVHWSKEQQLLFINSSSNSGEYESLARAVAGEKVTLVQGQDVFKLFARVNRLRLQNVGLSERLGKNIRYTGSMGADVEPAMSDARLRKTIKSVLSGTGFEGGSKVTVGASRKGRIWTIRRDRVDQLINWCQAVGSKLLDPTINAEEVLKGTLETRTVLERPASMPVGIDWPESIYTEVESMWHIELDGTSHELSDVGIECDSPANSGPLRVAIVAGNQRTILELTLYTLDEAPQYRFEHLSGAVAQIRRGSRAEPILLSEFFYDDPPTIWFSNGSSLEGNLLAEPRSAAPPLSLKKIQVWDWNGVDIRKESQGATREERTIQHRVIQKLKEDDYKVIFDDDGSGEIADVVAIRLNGSLEAPVEVAVDLYHCKYSQTGNPGARVGDLYEVCGQAQKSIVWASNPDKKTDIFTHLLRRNSAREELGGTRIERGDKELIETLRSISRICPVSLRVFIVQPGVSLKKISAEQLQLLGVTENYLHETYQLPLMVISNE